MDISIKPYQNLAEAIILSAVQDYRDALRDNGSRHGNHIRCNNHTIKECEKFFKSQWFTILSNADGEMIMNKIRKEVQNDSKTNSTHTKIYRTNR